MDTLKDYLIKISAHTEGISEAAGKLKNLAWTLTKTMLGVKALSTVVMSAARAVNKNFKEAVQLNDTLESTAKKLKKTTAEARAHQIALSVMGKTLQEINKSKELKATYDELMKLSKAFEFKEAPKGTIALKDITKELNKIKFVAKMGFSQVYEAFRTYCAKPLEQLRGWLKDFAEKLNANLGEVARKIGLFLAKAVKELLYHAQHLIQVVKQLWDWGVKIIKWWGTLPNSVKAAGAVIAAVIAMIQGKLKPLHMLLFSIYLLVDDFLTWSRGGKSVLGNTWQTIADLFKQIGDFLNDDVGKVTTLAGALGLLFGFTGKDGSGGFGGIISLITSPLGEAVTTLGLIWGAVTVIKGILVADDKTVGEKTAQVVTPVAKVVKWGYSKIENALGIKRGTTVNGLSLPTPSEATQLGIDIMNSDSGKVAVGKAVKTSLSNLLFGQPISQKSAVQRIASGAGSDSSNGKYNLVGQDASGAYVYSMGSGGGGSNTYPYYTNGSTNNVEKNVTVNTQAHISVSTSNAMSAAQQVSKGLASVIAQNVQSAIA